MVKLPLGVDLDNLIYDLKILSWEASEILIYYANKITDNNFRKDIIKSKDYDDPVTTADLKVNDLIIQRLKDNYSNIEWDILSEENVKSGSEKSITNHDWLWVLDPLDGTKDFIQGTGNYAMHLALNYKNEPILGIVLIPDKDELWISNGEKVWCENREGSHKRSNLAKNKKLKEMTVVISKNHRNNHLMNLIEKINFQDSLIMGSIGCKVASINRGESDIYISLSLPGQSSPKDWDFAAPAAILKTAGGAITDLDNKDLSYNKVDFAQSGIIIASSDKNTHKSICAQIKKIIIEYDLYPI